MSVSAAPRDLLRIGRWRSRHLVPADHPAPERVGSRVDEAIRRDLADALAAAAAHAAGPDELVFVRRLDLDVTIDAAWDRTAIARACASAFSRSLAQELSAGPTDNVIRFRSEAEYVAAYVATRALGDAPLPWFLERFHGWSYLPASAAIRSALSEVHEVGAEALTLLPASVLTAMALVLAPADVDAIVRVLPAAASSGDHRSAIRAALLACAGDPPPLHLVDRPGFVVWLAARASGQAGWPALRSAARLVGLVLHASGGTAPLGASLAAVAGDDRVLAAAAAADADHVDRAVRLASAVARVLAGVAPADAWPTRSTRFGGPFLLLDDLHALRLAELTADWPAPTGMTAAANAVSLVVLGTCLGTDRPTALFDDGVWRDLVSIPPQATGGVLAGWLDALDADRETAIASAAADVLRGFARRLPGFAQSSAPFLRRNFLDLAASLDFEPDRIVVTLTRPPLALVLGLTGRNRGERHWPWLDPRPFILFTEG